MLLHFLDLSHLPERDPIREYESLNRELALFAEDLAGKPQIVVVNKIDLPVVKEALPAVLNYFGERDTRVFPISSVTGEGIPSLLDEIAKKLWG
jgi:GTP-binding protein